MSYSLNSSKGGYIGDYMGTMLGVTSGYTKGLDDSSHCYTLPSHARNPKPLEALKDSLAIAARYLKQMHVALG